MAFDGNGNWIPEFSAKEDRDAGVKILASRFDDVFQQDLKESFEKCLTNDGQSRPLKDFNFNNHRGINVSDPETDTDVVNKRTLTSKIDNLLETMYPVGSVYIGTQEQCPMSALITGSVWELVGTDRALWGGNGSNANTTIEAGLPDHTHKIHLDISYDNVVTGNTVAGANRGQEGHIGVTKSVAESVSDTIYGKSDTVQPPAYRVNVWRRTS